MSIESWYAKRTYAVRTSLLVVAFTVILTTNFVGAMALLTEESLTITDRLPFYVLLAAIVFVATILILELAGNYDGRIVISTAITAGVLGFIFIFFGGEGIRHILLNPGEILTSHLLVYFLAAATIATGLGYWGLRHWREFANSRQL